MRVLALVVALLSVPAFAAEYTPWPDQGRKPMAATWIQQAQQTCCKRCTKGQPCGNSCISASSKCSRRDVHASDRSFASLGQ
jgi:hypothetical protein